MNKPISLPRISCEYFSKEKCITVPSLMEVSAGQTFELTLPKQVSKEINYRYAEDVQEPAPALRMWKYTRLCTWPAV